MTDPPRGWASILLPRVIVALVLVGIMILTLSSAVAEARLAAWLGAAVILTAVSTILGVLIRETRVRATQSTTIEVRGRTLELRRPMIWDARLRWTGDEISSIRSSFGTPTVTMEMVSDLVIVLKSGTSIQALTQRPKAEIIWIVGVLRAALTIPPDP